MLIHKQSPSAVMSYNLCHPSFFSWNHHLPSQGLFQVHDLIKLAMLYWQIGSLSCQQDIFVLSFVLLSFPPLPDLVQLTRFMLSAAKTARMPCEVHPQNHDKPNLCETTYMCLQVVFRKCWDNLYFSFAVL